MSIVMLQWNDTKNISQPLCKLLLFQWMRSHWQSDTCYSEFGVDGSECSFRVYLSEVETWCPLLKGRKVTLYNHTQPDTNRKKVIKWYIMNYKTSMKPNTCTKLKHSKLTLKLPEAFMLLYRANTPKKSALKTLPFTQEKMIWLKSMQE